MVKVVVKVVVVVMMMMVHGRFRSVWRLRGRCSMPARDQTPRQAQQLPPLMALALRAAVAARQWLMMGSGWRRGSGQLTTTKRAKVPQQVLLALLVLVLALLVLVLALLALLVLAVLRLERGTVRE